MRNLLVPIILVSFFLSCITKNQNEKSSFKNKILFVVSNQHTYGDSKINAANHFAEIVLAYNVLQEANYTIDFVSPKGGAIPIGYLNTSDSIQKKYLYDFKFMNLLKNTLKPDDIDAQNYAAIYYSGGGAAMFGVPENVKIQNITKQIYKHNGVVSAICHGTAGIATIKNSNEDYFFKGKKINGFPDKFENKAAGYYKEFPFSIEELVTKNGGEFLYSKNGWDNYYIVDGRLITGQDPSASATVAQKIIETLHKNQ